MSRAPASAGAQPPAGRLDARELRLLFVVASAVVFLETMFYAAVAPLLPSLTRELHLSKLSAGVLTASYAVGTLVGSIPAGLFAARAGPRQTIYAGLFLVAISSLAFGFFDSIVPLDAARFVQGLGGACTWAGSLAWLIDEVPVERRGSTIGGALAAAIGGALFGPVLGTLAHAVGRAPVFSAVAVGSVLIAIAVALFPAPRTRVDDGRRIRLLDQVRVPVIALSMWLVALPAIASGTLNVLGPLRLAALGAGALGIGATFLIAAGVEAGMSPAVGHVSDRRGRMLPLRAGLAITAVALLFFTLPRTAVLLAVVIVLQTIGIGIFWAPAMAMLSDAADSHGLSQGYAMALTNFAWAAGQIVGAAGGGALSKATSDAVPFTMCAVLCAATLALMIVRLPTTVRP